MGNEGERNTRSFVRSVMSVYEGEKIRVRVDSYLCAVYCARHKYPCNIIDDQQLIVKKKKKNK